MPRHGIKADRRNRAFELLKIAVTHLPPLTPEDAEMAQSLIANDVTLAYAYVDELDRQGGLTE